jgi:SpoVK/Ycf46/Vps4 family AAA+-type ATPase
LRRLKRTFLIPRTGSQARKIQAMSLFEDFEQFQRFKSAWSSVRIERTAEYGLFTFGDSELPYFLVTTSADKDRLVKIRRGKVTISRARIITPDTMHPELRNFFEEHEEAGLVNFLMSRTAAFSNLKLSNESGPERIVTDTVEEAVAKLNQQLDAEEENGVAVLSAPAAMAGFAVFRYASEKVMSSAPDNIQEMRERGLLP